MDDFIIQVLAALASAFIIFLIRIIFKFSQKISKQTWENILYNLIVIILYLCDVHLLIINLKSTMEQANLFVYLIRLMLLSFMLFSTIDLSIFISKNIIHKKS